MSKKISRKKPELDGTVCPRELAMKSHLSCQEKLVLELAAEIELEKDPGAYMTSWSSQVAAADYYNAHGFVQSLDHMLKLRGVRLPGSDSDNTDEAANDPPTP